MISHAELFDEWPFIYIRWEDTRTQGGTNYYLCFQQGGESASSKGFTKAPIITEVSKPPAPPPPTIPEIILNNILSVSDLS